MSVPASVIRPPIRSARPNTDFVVDLPAPFGPTTVTYSPASTYRSTSVNT